MFICTAQFNESFSPIADGVANTVKNYTLWLNRKYGKSVAVTPKFPGYIDNEEFEVLRYYSVPVPKRKPYRAGIPSADLKFRRRLSELDFDIIHAHSPFSSGRYALRIARQRDIPIVATFHSKFYEDFKAVLKSERLAQMALKKVVDFFNCVDQVWTVNNSTANTLKEYGYKGDIEIVENGTDFEVDVDIIAQNYQRRTNESRKNKNITYNLLYIGQLVIHKNLPFLIETLKILKSQGVNFNMTMVGEGCDRKEIERMVEQLDMKDMFKFTGKIGQRSELKKIYEQADLFIFPSIYDNAPLVVREAAACGCPSVVIENTNAAEGIQHNYNGYLSSCDADVFSRTIKEALLDINKRSEVAKNAALTIPKSWEKIVDEVAYRYKNLIEFYEKTVQSVT